MTSKMLQPELRFLEFTNPWKSEKLRNFTKVYDGTHQTPKYTDSGISFYSVTNVTSNNFAESKFISEDAYFKLAKNVKIEAGDILMTRIGDIGTARLVDWEYKSSFYVSLALIKKSQDIESQFLNQYISSERFQRELWQRTIHVAFPKKINLGEIGECKILLPEKREQKKIGSFLQYIDTVISNLTQQKEKLEKYNEGVIQKIFSQEIRFKDENGNDFPDWKTVELSQLFIARNEKCSNVKLELLSVSLSKGVTKYDDTIKKDSSNSDKSKYKIVRKNDIAYNTMRMWQGASGVSKFEGIVSPAYTVVTLKEGDVDFFGYLFKQPKVIHQFYRYSQGLTSDTWNLKFKHFAEVQVCIPQSIDEQKKITRYLKTFDEYFNHKNEEIKALKKWKQGLLQKMFA